MTDSIKKKKADKMFKKLGYEKKQKENLRATPIREQEEENYIVEYSPETSKHIPYID